MGLGNSDKNRGGVLGGAEYLGTKFVDGVVSNLEGIVDFVSGGIAQIFGNEEKAEEIFREDWYNYNRADEQYNPGAGMKVAGDISGVLGGAAPDVLLGIALGLGGVGVVGATLASAGTSFASGSGRGITEAVNTTDELGAKEWAGGVGSGALAAGIELASAGLGQAFGGVFGKTAVEIGSEITESAGKKASSKAIAGALGEVAEEGAQNASQGFLKKLFNSKVGKELFGEMVSEGIEEGLETWIEPTIQQNTYNPDAPNATLKDIGYSAMLGAVSGGLMSGGKLAINSTVNTTRGAKISGNQNSMSNLMQNALVISEYESEKQTGSEVFEAVSKLYNEVKKGLSSNEGRITLSTMKKIGELERMVTTAALTPSMVNAAKGIANNAESMAEALNNFYKKSGKDVTITAEMLTAGLDMDHGSQAFVRSVENAMASNSLLRQVVLNNMLGRMEFDARAYANSIFGNMDISTIATQQNLNRFLASADAATLNQLGAALGISNWATITPGELAARIEAFRDSGRAEAYSGGVKAVEKAKRAKGYTNGMPESVSSLRQGATRFKTANADFAIIREGNLFRLYDYETGHITKAMSLQDMETLVARLNQRAAEIDAESEMQALDREIDNFANENVPEYKKLTEAEKEAVRATLRSARANGISVKDQILFARIAAKSGLNIIVEPTIEADKPARYDGRNSIYINPKSPRTRLYSGLLGHEVFHKMFRSSKIKRLFMQAWNNIEEAKRDSVTKQYMAEEQKKRSYDSARRVSAEEVAAAYAEELFNNPGVWEYILSEEPSLKDRVIAFFKGAPKRYSFAPEMDAAAKKWIGEYKKLFDRVVARNAGMNVVEDVTTVDKKEEIKKIGKLVDELGGTATQVPKKVIKKIGKLVPEDKKTASGTKVQDSGERFAVATDNKPKITSDMTDKERADVLRNRTLTAPIYQGQADSVIEDVKRNYESEKKRFGKKAVVEIAEKLGILGENINFDDIDVQIELSKSNLRESIVKEADPSQVAKLLPILDQTAKDSVVVERHDNRYYYDTDTEYVDNLLGAYIEDNDLVPVRFGLKHSKTGRTTLYVLVDQNKIPLEKLGKIKNDRGHQDATADKSAVNSLPRSVTYSIPEILSLVNSKDLLRYIPDDFLDSARIEAKKKAIAETEEYTNRKNDEKYSGFVGEGNLRAAKDMLSAKAKAEGYETDFDWRMNHQAPNSHDDTGHSLDQIDKCYGGDGSIYSKHAVYYYGEGRSYDAKAIRVIQSAKSNPNAMIKIYRAVPTNVQDSRVRNGDWVAIVKEYAEEHGDRLLDGDYRIIENTVPAKHLWNNGDSINEFGYDNGNTNEVYKNTGNNVKTSEITYDDEGRLIPISKRYDSTNPDERYALADGSRATTTEVAAAKRNINSIGVDPAGIISIADKYFGRYDGKLTRTGVRYEFLSAAETLFDKFAGSMDRAYAKIEALADELTYNEKDASGVAEQFNDIKRHIREITFEVRDRDKGEFDSVGGYAQFRKDNFGKLNLANNGASVDSVYAEMQNLYGTSIFPEYNTVGEMLIHMAEVLNTEPDTRTMSDSDLEAARNEMTVAIAGELAQAFDNKIKPKSNRMSKADAEAYKARMNARAEVKSAKDIARAKKRLDQLEAKMRTKLKAEYETDTVFSESGIKKRLEGIEGYKSLPVKDRSEIAGRIWTELNESDGYNSREWIGLKLTTELTDKLVKQKNEAITAQERAAIFDRVNKTVKEIVESGRKSVRGKMEGEIREELSTKIKAYERYRTDTLSEIYQNLKKIDDAKTKRFAAASDYKGQEFKGSLDTLTKMDWRGKLNDNIVRSEMKSLLEWYREDNPMLKELTDKKFGRSEYNNSVRARLETLAQGEGELSREELGMLNDTISYFAKLVNDYDMVYSEGKWQSGTDLVYKLRDTIEKQKNVKVPLALRAMRNKILSGDLRAFADPLSVMKLADLYGDGIWTRTFKDWLQGEINAQAEILDMKSEYDAFMQDRKNKNYLAKARGEKVKIHDTEINKLQLISYVMTLKRKASWEGVAQNGVLFRTKDGQGVEMRPIAPMIKGRDYGKRLKTAIKAERELAEKLLTDQDKAFIQILERGFERAKTTKAQGDMQRLGFVNVVDGYYYPIRRAYTKHLSLFDAEMQANDKYASASFNKKTTEGAKSELLISEADGVFNNHVDGVAKYMYLSPVIDSFNKLYKLKVLNNKPGIGADIEALYKLQGSTFSLQSYIDKDKSTTTWRQDGKIVGFDYLQNLMMDTMNKSKGAVGDDFTGWIRSGYVGFALGGNPKALATQFSSLFASTSILDVGSHLRGVFVSGKDVDGYSTVAKIRNSDYDLLKTMAVTDKVGKLSKWFSQGMSLFDRIVVKRAFAAAQAQVAKTEGFKIGTDENLKAAGKLLDRVILETQQNALASRKTEAARRGGTLYRTMMMFKSDAVTTQGRVLDAWGEMQYLKAELKGAKGEGATEIKTKIKEAGKALKKANGALIGSALYMLVVSEAFRNLYGKADEDETDEEKAKRLRLELIGNLVGGMPAVSSIMETLTSGYDLEAMEFSAINDMLSTGKSAIDLAIKGIEGKADSKDIAKAGEKLIYTAGQMFGIPFRNLKNVAYGFTNLVSKETAYKWNAITKSPGYAADLNSALEREDYDMAEVIIELGFGEKMGSGLSDGSIKELMRLGKTGESVIPSAIGDSITVDGVERELSGEELKAAREKYAEATEMINMVIESDLYRSFDNEMRADAVRKIYNLYKNLAYDSAVNAGKDDEAYILSKIVGSEALCLNELAYMQASDVDANGNTISGSKRAKVVNAINSLDISDEEKLLLVATNGYSLKDGDVGNMSSKNADRTLYYYIADLNISDEEKLKLYKYAGYTVEGNKVSGSVAGGGSSSSSSTSGRRSGGLGNGGLGGNGKLGGNGNLGGSGKLGGGIRKIGKIV